MVPGTDASGGSRRGHCDLAGPLILLCAKIVQKLVRQQNILVIRLDIFTYIDSFCNHRRAERLTGNGGKDLRLVNLFDFLNLEKSRTECKILWIFCIFSLTI